MNHPRSVRWDMSQGSWNAVVAKSRAASTVFVPLGAVTEICARPVHGQTTSTQIRHAANPCLMGAIR